MDTEKTDNIMLLIGGIIILFGIGCLVMYQVMMIFFFLMGTIFFLWGIGLFRVWAKQIKGDMAGLSFKKKLKEGKKELDDWRKGDHND